MDGDDKNVKELSKKLGKFNFFDGLEIEKDSELSQKVQHRFDHVFHPVSKKTDPVRIAENENVALKDKNMSDDKKGGLEFNLPSFNFDDEILAHQAEDGTQKTVTKVAAGDSASARPEINETKKNEDIFSTELNLDFDEDLDQSTPAQDSTGKTVLLDLSSSGIKSELTEKATEAKKIANDGDSLLDNLSEISLPVEEPKGALELGASDHSEEFSLDNPAELGETQSANLGELDLGTSDDDDFEIESHGKNKSSRAMNEEGPSLDDLYADADQGEDFEEKTQVANSGGRSAGTKNSYGTNDYLAPEEARANMESTINDIIKTTKKDGSSPSFNLGDEAFEEVEEKTHLANLSDVINGENSSEFDVFDLSSANEDIDDGYEPTRIAGGVTGFKSLKNPANPKSNEDISFDTGMRKDLLSELGRDNIQDSKPFDDYKRKITKDGRLVFKNMENDFPPDMDEIVQKSRTESRRDEDNYRMYHEEEFVRVQATIRELREERDELLKELKGLRGENKELEEDNLSLRARVDELKIEQSVARKRHLAELEDLKYQLNLADEKKLTVEERLRLSEKNREKLEQKLRLDFSQVRQREKELENQLELLSIDHEAQIHTRDTKILELRRKIESLEFNMENISIKEQKNNDDKRKIEEKLMKIMKTLRHSIENIEDSEEYFDNTYAEHDKENE